MTQKDIDLEQLRLIDDFLEEDVVDSTNSYAFNAEIRQAITAVEEAGLQDIASAFDRERDDAWVASFCSR
ncbi:MULTISPECIES: hypothetical protein [unclassified Sphingomonas]|uniref:hypothetical protein n=1 Tax=unclassified Sphingomonas TaxID=196159 RepID=UPI0028657192|nr:MULTISPECIES: hypothetical protein [unclassified Sphingomonas]MDR6116024.1 hypothetical protein [Sphingomonas sp. SORGH_AS_0789]MDR6150303.1 hypothetical protein [Sphingomonas sp. SORGH_AS_0742]